MLYVSPDGRHSLRVLSIHHPPSEDVPALRSGRRGVAVQSGDQRHCQWCLRPPNEAGRLRTVCSVADIEDRTTDVLQFRPEASLVGTAESMQNCQSVVFVCHPPSNVWPAKVLAIRNERFRR